MSVVANASVDSSLTLEDVVLRAAADTTFFGQVFFPKAVRQESPDFHRDIDGLVENFRNRYVSIEVFRGGAKTTKLRIIVAKRVGFALSRTILFVSEAQDHSIRSLRWLKKQVEHNRDYADTFGLRPGSKWTDVEIEIRNDTEDCTISIIALGITGQTRGVNVDDYRPDFIVVDDPCDEENTATPEQRKKISDLFFGSLQKSLAPQSECPEATMVLLQTPLRKGDLITSCFEDPQWASARFGCFDEKGKSRWPDRWTTDELIEEKEAHIARNHLSLWMREMECKLVAEELAAFNHGWLEYWEELPRGAATYIGIDPTPPPKDSEQNTSSRTLDDACILVLMVYGGEYYVADYYITKSPNPEEFINKLFEMVIRWRPLNVGVETFLFQRVLKFYLDREKMARKTYFLTTAVEDRRKKSVRITQAITGPASMHKLKVHRSQTELIEQFAEYPDSAHDDILDALSIAMSLVHPLALEEDYLEGEYYRVEEENVKAITSMRGVP